MPTPKAQNDAIKILKKAELSELTSGRGPAGIAAAALYLAALLNNEKKTQREVADVAGVTEVTIRNRYKELLDKLDIEEKKKIKEAEKNLEKEEIKKDKGKTKDKDKIKVKEKEGKEEKVKEKPKKKSKK